jgi:hypothetical protein
VPHEYFGHTGIGAGVLVLKTLVLLGAGGEAQSCRNHALSASRNHFQSLVTTADNSEPGLECLVSFLLVASCTQEGGLGTRSN